jgi:hypothetical protein
MHTLMLLQQTSRCSEPCLPFLRLSGSLAFIVLPAPFSSGYCASEPNERPFAATRYPSGHSSVSNHKREEARAVTGSPDSFASLRWVLSAWARRDHLHLVWRALPGTGTGTNAKQSRRRLLLPRSSHADSGEVRVRRGSLEDDTALALPRYPSSSFLGVNMGGLHR